MFSHKKRRLAFFWGFETCTKKKFTLISTTFYVVANMI